MFLFSVSQFVSCAAFSSILAELMICFGCLFAAMKLHFSLLRGILHAPLSYFDQTPTGRILQRFSKEIEVLDVKLPDVLKWVIYCAAEVIFIFDSSLSQ